MVASLANFHFLRPAWLLALLAVLLLPWAWRHLGEAAGGWSRVVDPHLLAHQLQRGGRRRRSPLLLAMLASILAVLALAGPAWRELPQPLQQREAALAVVLEVSDSMRAGDLRPTRLARARFALTDLLRARRDGQAALVAYAGAAFTVAPVTDDAGTLLALLDALDPQQMPVPGARADLAIAHAVELLERAGFEDGEILVVTDGVDAGAVAAAEAARARGYAVSVLGVGTASGAPVALPDGGFLKDQSGAILVPGMDAAQLAEVAAAGGGRYSTLDATASGAAIDLLDRVGGRYQQDDDAARAFVDDGPWLLLLLLPLAALGFRRGWLGCLLLVGLSPPPAQAFELESLWKRDDQRAWEALQDGDHERAAALADSPALRGTALFRAGEPEGAADAFAQAPGATGHYNRGNALAAAERYQEALDAYAAALAIDPTMEDAAANRRAVEEWLQQQSQPQSGEGDRSGQQSGDGEPQQEPQPREGEGEPNEGGKSEQSGGEQQQQQQSGQDGQQSGDEPQQEGADAGEPQDAGEDAAQEQQFGEQMQQAIEEAGQRDGEAAAVAVDPADAEQRQAVEQWLRRVPDDPGGLLRRKFLIEHQRREREGDQP